VRPNVNSIFKPGDPLGVYMQVYNPGIDQTTLRPAVDIEYVISRDGKEILRLPEDGQNGLSRFTTQQITLARLLPVESLQPGTYTLQVRITDQVKQTTVTPQIKFTILAPTSDDLSRR